MKPFPAWMPIAFSTAVEARYPTPTTMLYCRQLKLKAILKAVYRIYVSSAATRRFLHGLLSSPVNLHRQSDKT